MNIRTLLVPAILGVLLARPPAAPAQQVFKSVSDPTVERVLAGLNIQFQKAPANGNVPSFYVYVRNGTPVRLVTYGGQAVELNHVYTDRPTLELVNRWNVEAKFSRAVLVQNANGGADFIVLQSVLDPTGGCTDAMVRRHILRFDDEVRRFARLAQN